MDTYLPHAHVELPDGNPETSPLQAASQRFGKACTEGLEVKGWCIWVKKKQEIDSMFIVMFPQTVW